MVQRSASTSGLIPRAPTGSDWARSNKEDNKSSVGLSEMLKDLDRQAGYVWAAIFLVVVAVVVVVVVVCLNFFFRILLVFAWCCSSPCFLFFSCFFCPYIVCFLFASTNNMFLSCVSCFLFVSLFIELKIG